MIPPFILGAILVVAIFQVNEYLNLKNTPGLEKAGEWAILRLLLLQTPSVLNFTLPISVALASAVAMSRLARESELTALRSAGARIVRVVFPMSIFGLAIGLANLVLVDQLIPVTSRAVFDIKRQHSGADTFDKFASNVSIKVQNRLVSIGTATRQADNSVLLKDVLILDDRNKTTTTVSTAKDGFYHDGIWTFPSVRSWSFTSKKVNPAFQKSAPLNLKEPISVQDLFTKLIKEQKRLCQDVRQLEIEYQVKFSVPAMCWIFALVSPVFSILFARQGGFVGVLISLVVVLAYYNVWVVSTQILTKATSITPVNAAWLPNIIFLIVGLIGLRSLE